MKTQVKKSKTTEPTAGSIKAASSRTGLSEDAIRAIKASGAPCWAKNGNIDCACLLDYAAQHPEILKQVDEAPSYQLEKALDMRANRKLKEQKLEERNKQLIPISTIRTDWTRNVISCKTKFTTAENAIATEMGMKAGLTPPQIAMLREIVQKHVRLSVKELHVGDYGKCLCPECGEEIKP